MTQSNIAIRFRFVEGADRLLPPLVKATQFASGYDLRADLLRLEPTSQKIVISPTCWKLIPTGLSLEIPNGLEGQIRPRSGIALKFGVTILNAPGTIDSDYRGEVGVILINHGPHEFTVNHGDRIAQIVFAHVPDTECIKGDTLSHTERGEQGFGSSGRG